jgi:hypothetical protein
MTRREVLLVWPPQPSVVYPSALFALSPQQTCCASLPF